jgi:hypothetical protein
LFDQGHCLCLTNVERFERLELVDDASRTTILCDDNIIIGWNEMHRVGVHFEHGKITMLYTYSFSVYIDDANAQPGNRSRYVCSLKLIIDATEEAHDYFSDDVNGCGPSAELEQFIANMVCDKERDIEEKCGLAEGCMKNMLYYSFPIECSHETTEEEIKTIPYVYKYTPDLDDSDEEND